MQNRFNVQKWLAHAVQCVLMVAAAMAAPSAYSASKTIVVLGDSLSAGYGLPLGTGWVPLMQQRLATEKIDATVINASISGDTTSGGMARLPALLQQHPSIVIIELGANDGLRGMPLTVPEANLKKMIADSQAAHAKVLLVGTQLPSNYGPDYTKRFVAMFGKLAKDLNTALVPSLFAGLQDNSENLQPDHLHPTAKVQGVLLDNVWQPLKPLLSK
jgi:acyl-CoA thioesterase-1